MADWTRKIFEFGETAWREYRSAAFYVDLLRREGELTEEDLMHTIFPHPTLSEMMHEAVLASEGRAMHI